ncbi:stage II sporulation protein AA (anti-sigma F factor antagonist) [Lentzea xinjiangensis]|uniref:Anti-sigma factor antagonist n=1 Tax=Lentzea xinjiangensis TaxID=402600 RepID=A0A1H9NYQ1_9PSEU|nr:STAS domain-containing protein [Lentzea xinjiangensis]SER40775.1 stage II sporulation protein AA (anti-sigma F factor antagonist) [Lentzea xinjiangensis]
MPDPTALASVVVDRITSDVVVLHVSGELDTTSSSELNGPLDSHVVEANRAVVVDLAGVKFLGSAGLEALVLGQQRASRAGVDFIVVAAARAALRPIEATGLDSVFTIVRSVDEAVERYTASK